MSVDLRPLGVGEIFDRAVTLYVRNFALFTIIAAFVVVPLTIVRYFFAMSQTGAWAQLLEQMKHPEKHAPASAGFSPWLFVFVFVAFILTPFMYVAVASAIGRLYSGEAAKWQDAYGVSLRHAGGIIGSAIAQVVILFCVLVAGGIALGLLMVISAIAVRDMVGVGVVLVIFTIVCGIALFAGIMLCYLATAIAYDAIGVEGTPFLRAIGSGFARIFNRREIGKALLICLAFIAIEIGLMIVSVGIASIGEAVLRQPLLESVVQGVLSLFVTGFIGVLLAVYYFDVRIRSEGLDLQAELDRLQAQPQA